MYHKLQTSRIGSYRLIIAIILFILLLATPVQCVVSINIDSKYPASFLDDEDIIINCYYKYEKQLESCVVSVNEYNTNKNIYKINILLDDKSPGEHSPWSKSISIGKIKAGLYVVELKSVPKERKSKGDFASAFLKVSEATGNLLINTFHDVNNNGNKDAKEGLSERSFRIGKVGEPRLEYEETSNESGALFVSLGTGQYIIEQIPKDNWIVAGETIKNISVSKGQTTFLEFKNIHEVPASQENYWLIVLVLFSISLLLVEAYKNKIYPQKVHKILKYFIDIILILILFKLIELAGLHPYENYVISIIGLIFLAPVLHKLSEFIIAEFLIKYTVGSAIAGFLSYLDILSNVEIVLGERMAFTETNLIIEAIIRIIVLLILMYLIHALYEQFKKIFGLSKKADIIVVLIFFLGNLFTGLYHSPVSPEILSLVTDSPNLVMDSTVVLTAEVKNPSNVNILYRFFLNDDPLTEWMHKSQCIWTITESELEEAKVEVRIKGESMSGDDIYDSKSIIANIKKVTYNN